MAWAMHTSERAIREAQEAGACVFVPCQQCKALSRRKPGDAGVWAFFDAYPRLLVKPGSPILYEVSGSPEEAATYYALLQRTPDEPGSTFVAARFE